jgi:hypothetical protein
MTTRVLARQLLRDFPDGLDVGVLFDRCEEAGLDPQEVDAALDDLRDRSKVEKRTIHEGGLRISNLTSLPSVRTRIKGSAYWVTDEQRRRHGGAKYVLVREPNNEHDPNAVAVYGRGRKVGHLSAAKAASIAPILDKIGAEGFRVTGAGTSLNSITLWVDVPRLDALRKFAAAER